MISSSVISTKGKAQAFSVAVKVGNRAGHKEKWLGKKRKLYDHISKYKPVPQI